MQVVLEPSFMLMVIYMKGHGQIISAMVKALIQILTVPDMKVIGRMISSMDRESKHGQKVQNIKEVIT